MRKIFILLISIISLTLMGCTGLTKLNNEDIVIDSIYKDKSYNFNFKATKANFADISLNSIAFESKLDIETLASNAVANSIVTKTENGYLLSTEKEDYYLCKTDDNWYNITSNLFHFINDQDMYCVTFPVQFTNVVYDIFYYDNEEGITLNCTFDEFVNYYKENENYEVSSIDNKITLTYLNKHDMKENLNFISVTFEYVDNAYKIITEEI